MTERRHPDSVHPYLAHSAFVGRPIPFAHRGGTSRFPENTVEAFVHAHDLGYRYLETDAHLSADGQLVAFHDTDLSRTCGIDRTIGEMTWAQLAEVQVVGDAAARQGQQDAAGEPGSIPLLRDLLDRFPDAHFNIDAKSDASVSPLCALVDELGAHDRVCLASFSLRRLRRIRRHFGHRVMTNMASPEIGRLLSLGRVGALADTAPVAAQVPPRQGRLPVVTQRSVRRARAAGVPVHVWTINDRPEMQRLLDLGVDGIMTDEVELLKQVFTERGLWPT